MEEEVDVTPVESVAEDAILERVSEGTEEVAGNTEYELPDALQDLLWRLHGVLRSDEEGITELPGLEDGKYGDFFKGMEESGTRSEMPIKVLEVIGKCKTLEKFCNFSLPHYKLSAKEWEAVFVPIHNNLEGEEIEWYSLEPSQIEEVGPLLHDRFAKARNLANLEIRGAGRPVRAKSVAAVALGLRVNAYHRLRLYLECTIQEACDDDAIVVTHAGEIISSPELSELTLNRIAGNAQEALIAARKGSVKPRQLNMSLVKAEGIAEVSAEVYGRTSPRMESLMLWDWRRGDEMGVLLPIPTLDVLL